MNAKLILRKHDGKEFVCEDYSEIGKILRDNGFATFVENTLNLMDVTDNDLVWFAKNWQRNFHDCEVFWEIIEKEQEYIVEDDEQ